MPFEFNKKDNFIINMEHQRKDDISETVTSVQFKDQDNFDTDVERSSNKFEGL